LIKNNSATEFNHCIS